MLPDTSKAVRRLWGEYSENKRYDVLFFMNFSRGQVRSHL